MKTRSLVRVVPLGVLLAAALPLLGQTVAPAASKAKIERIREVAGQRMWVQADAYWHEGEHFHLMRLLYLVVEADPQNTEAFEDLGWLLASNKLDSAAVSVYEHAIAANPKQWGPHYEIGFYYFNRKDYLNALAPLVTATEKMKAGGDWTKRSVAQNPGLLNPWRLLAHTYERLNKLNECVGVWDRVLQIAPTDAPAKLNRDRVKELIAGKKPAEEG